jgi:hypothetical protein
MYRTSYIHYTLSPLSFHLCLIFSHLCILDSFFNSWSMLVHYQALLVHVKQAIIETNLKSSTHVPFAICQMCLLSHDAMISHNIEVILLIPFALLSFTWIRLFPWSSNTMTHNFGLLTLWGISSSLTSCWTYRHFSFHNPQVYAINSISCSTLSKLVRPLIMLSFNSLKPTKWLDALSISLFLVIDDNIIKAYKRLINSKILNPMI